MGSEQNVRYYLVMFPYKKGSKKLYFGPSQRISKRSNTCAMYGTIQTPKNSSGYVKIIMVSKGKVGIAVRKKWHWRLEVVSFVQVYDPIDNSTVNTVYKLSLIHPDLGGTSQTRF